MRSSVSWCVVGSPGFTVWSSHVVISSCSALLSYLLLLLIHVVVLWVLARLRSLVLVESLLPTPCLWVLKFLPACVPHSALTQVDNPTRFPCMKDCCCIYFFLWISQPVHCIFLLIFFRNSLTVITSWEVWCVGWSTISCWWCSSAGSCAGLVLALWLVHPQSHSGSSAMSCNSNQRVSFVTYVFIVIGNRTISHCFWTHYPQVVGGRLCLQAKKNSLDIWVMICKKFWMNWRVIHDKQRFKVQIFLATVTLRIRSEVFVEPVCANSCNHLGFLIELQHMFSWNTLSCQ